MAKCSKQALFYLRRKRKFSLISDVELWMIASKASAHTELFIEHQAHDLTAVALISAHIQQDTSIHDFISFTTCVVDQLWTVSMRDICFWSKRGKKLSVPYPLLDKM